MRVRIACPRPPIPKPAAYLETTGGRTARAEIRSEIITIDKSPSPQPLWVMRYCRYLPPTRFPNQAA